MVHDKETDDDAVNCCVVGDRRYVLCIFGFQISGILSDSAQWIYALLAALDLSRCRPNYNLKKRSLSASCNSFKNT